MPPTVTVWLIFTKDGAGLTSWVVGGSVVTGMVLLELGGIVVGGETYELASRGELEDA
jgi:hypothetical protein